MTSTRPERGTGGLVVVTALRSEHAALARRVPGARIARCGMGARRAAAWSPRLAKLDPRAVVVAGVAGGIDPAVRPGDVVVATEVRDARGSTPLPAATLLVADLRRLGLRVHAGPVLSSDHIVGTAERARLVDRGVLAVDLESAVLLAGLPTGVGRTGSGRTGSGRAGSGPVDYGPVPAAVVRVVVDTADSPLVRPATVISGVRALHTLGRIGPALNRWSALAGPRRVVLAAPRSFCAGVERAIDTVELALARYSRPVYVRRQIVHNAAVVADLQARGAVFVDELHEVPDGTPVVFSAHGVGAAVRDEAARRGLTVVDATCPLVAKVHTEVRRFAARGDTVLFVGHGDHDETEGVLGELPGRVTLVTDVAEAEWVGAADPGHVAVLTQTTLAVDEAAEVVDTLRRRFPHLETPATSDICYATTNRQQAVREIAERCDVLLVLGSANSSNSVRLVEVAERCGVRAHLVEDATGIVPEWLDGAATVGVTAGASAPPRLVAGLLDTLRGLGPVEVVEHVVTREDVRFALPREVVE